MRNRFRMIHHSNGYYYWHDDTHTGERQSLGIQDKEEARRLLMAKKQSSEQPTLSNGLNPIPTWTLFFVLHWPIYGL